MGNTNVDSLVCDIGGITVTPAGSGITLNGLTLTIIGQASETYDAGAVDDGNEEVGELTVTGAALGDYCLASFSLDVADLHFTAHVTAANTVTYQLLNNTGGTINLAEGVAKVAVLRIA